ncbi:MAG: T9SS type A sorting domain-containing protein [candidate division Zixibacteria bacterium]|nr:T9SS type A sorting domain-containing protein [candidate division Zixibacteria bacterium]
MRALLIVLTAFLLLNGSLFAQGDPNDSGNPDTLVMVMTHPPDPGTDDSSMVTELYVYNDVDSVTSLTAGFRWINDDLILDSAVVSPLAETYLNMQTFVYYANDINLSNDSNLCTFGGFRVSGNGFPPSNDRKLLATYYWHLEAFAPGDSIIIDTLEYNTGARLKFVNSSNIAYIPRWAGACEFHDVLDVDGDDLAPLPTSYRLAQNYPNPFNPSTIISFDLPRRSPVELTVINVLGQTVKALVRADLPAGCHTVHWDGTDASGGRAASGIYFYRMVAENTILSRKMLLLK